MTTTETVLLIVVTVLLSLFIIICIAVAIGILELISIAKRVATKAEAVVDSVEDAAETIKDAKGPVATVRAIREIVKLIQRNRR